MSALPACTQQQPPFVFFLEESFFEDEAFLDVFFSFFPEDNVVEVVGAVVAAVVEDTMVVGATGIGSAAGTVVAIGATGSIICIWGIIGAAVAAGMVIGTCAGYAIIDGAV